MGGLKKGIISLTTGNLVAQLITIATMPIITRLYTPQEYGVFAIFLSLLMIIYPISALHYHSAITLPSDNNIASDVVKLSTISIIITTTFLGLVLLFLSDIVDVEWFTILQNEKVLWLLPVAVLLQSLLLITTLWKIRNDDYVPVARARITEAFFDRVLTIIYANVNFGVIGFILGRVFGTIIALLFLLRKSSLSVKINRSNYFKIRKVASRYKAFPRYSIPATLLISVSREVPIFLLALFFNPLVVGSYALALRIVNMPMMLVGDGVSKAFFQKASKLKSNNKALDQHVLLLFHYMIYFIVPPLIFLAFYGDDLFSIIFGEKWRNSGKYTQILALSFFAMFLNRTLAVLFDVYEKQKEKLVFSMVLLFVRVSTILVAVNVTESVEIIILALSIVTFCVYMPCSFYLLKLSNVNLLDVLKVIKKNIAVLMMIIIGMPILHMYVCTEQYLSIALAFILMVVQGILVIISDKLLFNYMKGIYNKYI